jgi:hypothetical protein
MYAPPAKGAKDTESPSEDAAEGGEDSEVDPEFKDTAAELFPDWPDEDFGKLQKLIDMRVNSGGAGGMMGAEPC